MVKLYKFEGGKVSYWEAWSNIPRSERHVGMKQILITLVVVAISCLALTETKARRSQRENAMKKLEDLDRRLNKARWYLDVEALDRILADDWFGTLIWSDLVGKAAFLREIKPSSGQREKEGLPVSHSNDEIKARLHGDVAIVTGVLETTYDGHTIRLHYTNVYLKREGVWRAISTHESFAESEMPPVSAPADPKPPIVHNPVLPKKP